MRTVRKTIAREFEYPEFAAGERVRRKADAPPNLRIEAGGTYVVSRFHEPDSPEDVACIALVGVPILFDATHFEEAD